MEHLLHLEPSETNWNVIVQYLNQASDNDIQAFFNKSDFLNNWADQYRIAPNDWLFNALEKEEPKLSFCKCFETDFFTERFYDRATAEKVLGLPIYLEQSLPDQLETLLNIFSHISDYNQLQISIKEEANSSSIDELILEKIDQYCPGNEKPTITNIKIEKEQDVEQAIRKFLEGWFGWMDTFPRADFLYFMNAIILPTFKAYIDSNMVQSAIYGQKYDRSYQTNNVLILRTDVISYVFNMHCDIY